MSGQATDRRRAGYSVLELLIVLAVMALATAVVLPQGALMLDRLVLHAVQFEFQTSVSDLRRKAYASETAVDVVSSDDKAGIGRGMVALRAGWTYRLDQPLRITGGGHCSSVRSEILRLGRTMMHLTSTDGACHFIRLD